MSVQKHVIAQAWAQEFWLRLAAAAGPPPMRCKSQQYDMRWTHFVLIAPHQTKLGGVGCGSTRRPGRYLSVGDLVLNVGGSAQIPISQHHEIEYVETHAAVLRPSV